MNPEGASTPKKHIERTPIESQPETNEPTDAEGRATQTQEEYEAKKVWGQQAADDFYKELMKKEGIDVDVLQSPLLSIEEEFKRKQAERMAAAKREAASLVERQTTTSPQETVIRSRESLSSSELKGGVNRTEFVQLKDDGSVVFKPIAGETGLGYMNLEPGTYYKRERAAYAVSEFFGFELVPPTVIRELNGELGSAQEFIPGAKPAYDLFLGRDRSSAWEKVNLVGKYYDWKYEAALNRLFIFDHLIWNIDRHYGNFLLEGGKVYAIDNGLSFNRGDDKYADRLDWRAHMQGFEYDKKVPADILVRLQEFSSDAASEEKLRSQLDGLLSAEEIEAIVFRAKEIARVSEKISLQKDERRKSTWDLPFAKPA